MNHLLIIEKELKYCAFSFLNCYLRLVWILKEPARKAKVRQIELQQQLRVKFMIIMGGSVKWLRLRLSIERSDVRGPP